MAWICEWCGWENDQDHRVGLKEPECIRCRLQRGSRSSKIEELEEEVSDYQEYIRESLDRITHFKGMIASIESELHSATSQHDAVVKEVSTTIDLLEKAQGRLNELKSISRGKRLIADDQTTLERVKA